MKDAADFKDASPSQDRLYVYFDFTLLTAVMDAQSLSGVYKSNLQYEQLTSTSFVPVMIEHYFDPAADAVHVAVVADRWGGICREIAEHVYAEYERKPVPPPIQSDYMHGVSAMIIGLRAKVGAHDILAKLQQLRALCKETMSSEQAALQNKVCPDQLSTRLGTYAGTDQKDVARVDTFQQRATP